MPRKLRVSETTPAERRAHRPERVDCHQLYSLAEAGAALDMSRAALYRAIRSGRLKLAPALDSRPRIPGHEILRVTGALDVEAQP